VITKSLSRFGRDTVDTLEALKILGESDVRVIFEQENLDSAETDNQLMISIVRHWHKQKTRVEAKTSNGVLRRSRIRNFKIS